MEPIIIKLKPNSRFHFGKIALDPNVALSDTDEFIHSDLLFSALVNNLAQIKDKDFVNRFIDCFRSDKIKISSGYYCIEQDRKYTYLLPRPIHAPTFFSEEYENIKKIKDIRFITPAVLRKHPSSWTQNCIPVGNVLFSPEEINRNIKPSHILYSKEVVPHLVKHKPNENAEGPFSLRIIQIPELDSSTVHFYFLHEISPDIDDELKEAFYFTVEMIKFNGLGGERSSGCGQVEDIIVGDPLFKQNELYTIIKDKSEIRMSLGLIIPADENEFNKFSFYDYITRGGRMTNRHGELKRVHMLSEGSVIQSAKEIKCSTEDISQEGNQYYLRYGQALTINIPNFYRHEE